ncbi:MAG: FAD-dependent oxidoreductase [Candidatus Paceibacterota bacterium]|jgi:thioredoxin-disulfide reductase
MDSYDLVIIGGGPAGITAGIYAARQKLKTLLITKDFGGQIMRKAVGIENYPGFEQISSLELIERLEKHLNSYNLPVEFEEVAELSKLDGLFLITGKDGGKFSAKAVIIASGAVPRFLNVPGEKEFVGRGVSYCTACDGPMFSDKNVVVAGGGNAGFETAIFMANYAKKIYIMESGETVRADAANQEKAKLLGKIEVITSAALKEISGQKFVDKVIYKDLAGGQEKIINAEGVFIEVGYQPSSVFVKEDLVDFNNGKEIKVDFENLKTKTPGLFAAGDVNAGKSKQIIIACGQGAKAALEAYKYLQEETKENKINIS